MSFSDQTKQDQKAEGGADTTAQTTDNKPFLVLGDRVFQTQDDLVKSYSAAQEHIKKVESENAQYREKTEEGVNQSTQEFARQILDGLKQDRKADQDQGQSSKVTLSEEELAEKVLAKLQQKQTQAQKEANMDVCEGLASKVFGEDYEARIVAKAKELNMDMESVNLLAERSPEGWAKLFLPQERQTSGKSFAANSDQSTTALDKRFNEGRSAPSASIKNLSTKDTMNKMYEIGKEYGLYD